LPNPDLKNSMRDQMLTVLLSNCPFAELYILSAESYGE
jgi:hypothetical protein